MDQDDLPDFLQLNGFGTKAGMFGASGISAAPAPRLPAFPAAPPNPIPFAPAIPALPTGNFTFDPTVGGALGMRPPAVNFLPPAPTPVATAKPKYRVPPPEIIAAAQDMQRRWGVPASVSLAQWAIESRWGAGMPKDSNNPFGIKAVKGQPSVGAWTTEYDTKGKPQPTYAYFRKFGSLDDAWDSRSKMLATSGLYADARPHLSDPDAFVDAIGKTYAPRNPKYARSIKDMMRINHLYGYNGLPGTHAAGQ